MLNNTRESWYSANEHEIYKSFDTSIDGLTEYEAEKRIEQYGLNELPQEEATTPWKIFRHQFVDPLIYVLIVAALVSIALDERTDAAVIMAVVLLNAVVGFFQEYKAEKAMKALAKLLSPKAKVVREGFEKVIDAEKLVPGDIVVVASGDVVPADIRVVNLRHLRVDESMLTGESSPVTKTVQAIKAEKLSSSDQKNMLFMGSNISSGNATGVVTGTGFSTQLGSITEEVRRAGIGGKTPLQIRIQKLTRLIIIGIVGGSLAVFAAGLYLGGDPLDMFFTAVALAVSAIPEGLPVVLTITLAIGVSRMARTNSIIRKLPAVETLGSCTIIGSDKTGTLTKNQMTVQKIYDGQAIYDISGIGYKPEGSLLREGQVVNYEDSEALKMTLYCGILSNESYLVEQDDQWRIEGDPTEGCLIVSAIKSGIDYEVVKNEFSQLDLLPFESERKYMASLNSVGGKQYIFIKGAPEVIVSLCKKQMVDGGFGIVNQEEILETARSLAGQGLRVLAMALKPMPGNTEIEHDDISELTFLGLQGMLDPPRKEAIEAVAGCRSSGISVLMITGDNKETALSIASMMGIAASGDRALTGYDLDEMTEEELSRDLGSVKVFARVSPHHKLRIVNGLRERGEIVAVTGDGVNDAPALKAAHIGIAMGVTGTDVAKEASDMVLVDDNFNSIYKAVLEGRVVFDNIKKATFFLLSTGVGEVIAILASVIMRIPIPFLPVQILWLNLVTNGLQDVALAFEPGEKDVPQRKPRPVKEGILTKLLLERLLVVGIVLAVGSLYIFLSNYLNGTELAMSRTAALTTMVFFQFFHVFNSRSETRSVFTMNPLKNKFLFVTAIGAFLAQLAFIYLPTMQFIFKTEPLPLEAWIPIILTASTVVAAMEIDKLIRRRVQLPVNT